ncbi:MAG: ThuA domain-containing protein [Oscillochloris sp.]|nr:ThuA domain-containing protein [Oscillochloris sp.]
MIAVKLQNIRVLLLGLLAYCLLLSTACIPLQAKEPLIPTNDLPPDAAALLVFSKTAGYRHASISDGIAAIQTIGVEYGLRVDTTEDAAIFSDQGLAPYRAVIFLNTTGDILDAAQEAAFERYIRAGNGYVGVHAASDTEYDWAWYGGLVGAYFADHPAIQTATVQTSDQSHPSTVGLPAAWQRRDEWYNFGSLPPAEAQILLTIDEESYSGGTMGDLHPLSWAQQYDGGRSWYTAMGHTGESFSEPLFLAHLSGGILWAAGLSDATALYLPKLQH